MLFGLKKGKNVKEQVIYILGQKWPLTTKKIYNIIKKKRSISYQAVHKTLKKLMNEGIIERKDKKYYINVNWLEKTGQSIQRIRDNYLHHRPFYFEGISEFKENNGTQIFVFKSLKDAETYRKKLQWEYIAKKRNKPPYFGQTIHLKSPVVYSEKSLNVLDLVKKTRTQCYIAVNGGTKIDEWCADYYKDKFVRVKTGVNCAQNCETMIIGNTVTQLYIPEKIRLLIDNFYSNSEDITNIDIQEFYDKVYKKNTKIKFVVIKNPEITYQLRKQTLSFFNKEKIAVFDIDGVLTKSFVIFDFTKYLVKKNKFNKKNFNKMKKIFKKYKAARMGYNKFTTAFLYNYAIGLKNRKQTEIEAMSEKFSGKIDLFPYSRKLFKLVNESRKTVAITASPAETIKIITNNFDFDFVATTELEVRNNKYTGKISIDLSNKKAKSKEFEKYIENNAVTLEDSIGFGDTHHDASFLNEVDIPVVLNPNKKLKEIAQKKEWLIPDKNNIISEIKNIL